ELLGIIIKETTKKDQKSLRLSSRYFNAFIPSDFMQSIISQTDRVSDRCWPAPTHFGHLVTTLTLQAVDYEELHCQGWGDELKERWHGHYMMDKLLYNDANIANKLGEYTGVAVSNYNMIPYGFWPYLVTSCSTCLTWSTSASPTPPTEFGRSLMLIASVKSEAAHSKAKA
ncbi:MAG: hypothetical protein Q9198_011165, partial [Flavoplaca austrocitrina]